MGNPNVQFEWLFEVLNKRVKMGIKLKDLFLCVPYVDEAEFEFELTNAFNNYGKAQGIDLFEDYPALAKILGHNKKESTIRVFLIKPYRLKNPVVLWTKKFNYPKVNQPFNNPKFLLAKRAFENIQERNIKEHIIN